MKSLLTGGLLVASLALIGNTAMAANIPAHKHAPAVRHLVQRLPAGQTNGDIGQFFQSIFGGQPVQYSGLTARPSRRSQGSYAPSYDSSPAVDNSSAASDSTAASDAAIQSMNDQSALNASMAAAEAQNEAAQASALQTEINANNQ
jgi:hypothetical protein